MSKAKPALEPNSPQVVGQVLERLKTMPIEELNALLARDTPQDKEMTKSLSSKS
jgi:hypothetical protein